MISLGINIGANSTVYANCGYDNNHQLFTKTLMNDTSLRETPSVLVFTNKERKAGNTATNDFKTFANSSFLNISRYIGLDKSPFANDEQKYFYVQRKNVQYSNEVIYPFQCEDNIKFYPKCDYIVAAYLQKINKQYNRYNSEFQFENLTISIPDFFTLPQKQSIRIILTALGVKNFEVINESTAITLYYGYNKYKELFEINSNNKKNILFIDAGHSKTSFILSQFSFTEFKVLGEEIFEYAKMEYRNSFKEEFPNNPKKKVQLFTEIKRCRENLSINAEMEIKLENFHGNEDFIFILTREKFEGIVYKLINLFSMELNDFYKDLTD